MNPAFYSALARSILAGEAAVESISGRIAGTLGKNWRWLKPLAQRYLASFDAASRPGRKDVIAFLKMDEGLHAAARKYRDEIRIANWIQGPQSMRPAAAARGWPIPAIPTVGDLAEWLKVSAGDLEWFADLRRISSRAGDGKHESPISHYHYRILSKGNGNIRLIESPKRRLKKLQQKILGGILEKIPIHDAAHGFRKGRSIRSFAAPHVGRHVVMRIDLRDFFPSIGAARVRAFFRTAGYPEPVADRLGGICTNAAPRALWVQSSQGLNSMAMAEARVLYLRRHLPQGAPTSPALSNLCFYRADCRLSGLARVAGASYTRYADDLAFSGGEDFARRVDRFATQVAAILLEEGFEVHHRKTRVMRQGVRQYLAGLVTNAHINVVREDFDRLKAILTNCVRHGAVSQNRERHPAFRAHLEGRVGFVESVNPVKGARLRRIFNLIEWT